MTTNKLVIGELTGNKTLNKSRSKQYLELTSRIVQKYIYEEDGTFIPLLVSVSVINQRQFLVVYYTPKHCLSRLSKPMLASLRDELYDAYLNFELINEVTQASSIPNHAATHVKLQPNDNILKKKKRKGVKNNGIVHQQPWKEF